MRASTGRGVLLQKKTPNSQLNNAQLSLIGSYSCPLTWAAFRVLLQASQSCCLFAAAHQLLFLQHCSLIQRSAANPSHPHQCVLPTHH